MLVDWGFFSLLAQVEDLDGLMTGVQLAQYLGISRWTVGYWRRQGKGPRPIKLNPSLTVYRRSDAVQWVRENDWQLPEQHEPAS